MDFASLVEARLAELGENVNSFEARQGWSQGYLRAVVRNDDKRTVPNIERAEKISRALGFDFYIGPKRETGPVTQIQIQGNDFAHVPLFGASLSAGNGSVNSGDVVVDHLAFRREWLRKIGVSPSDAVLARVANGELGESMMPTISPGDMLLIDTSKKELPQERATAKGRKNPIYAFTTSEGARVKRIARNKGTVFLISDNPDVAPEVVDPAAWDGVNVIGKVMWWGHTAEE